MKYKAFAIFAIFALAACELVVIQNKTVQKAPPALSQDGPLNVALLFKMYADSSNARKATELLADSTAKRLTGEMQFEALPEVERFLGIIAGQSVTSTAIDTLSDVKATVHLELNNTRKAVLNAIKIKELWYLWRYEYFSDKTKYTGNKKTNAGRG